MLKKFKVTDSLKNANIDLIQKYEGGTKDLKNCLPISLHSVVGEALLRTE